MLNPKDKNVDIAEINAMLRLSAKDVVKMAEDFFASQIKKAADSAEKVRIVLLSGPSGSGKTTTANMLCEELIRRGKKAKVISLDNFYKLPDDLPIIDGRANAEVLEALDIDLLRHTVGDVLDDGHVWLPIYDFAEKTRNDQAEEVDIGNDGIWIFEGLHALNPIIRAMVPDDRLYCIYVSPHNDFIIDGRVILERRDVRFLRRMLRDDRTRGTLPERTYAMWRDVGNYEDTLVRPLGATADIHINSSHLYEIGLMKKSAENILAKVPENCDFTPFAKRLYDALKEFEAVDFSLLPEGSLLHEFVG